MVNRSLGILALLLVLTWFSTSAPADPAPDADLAAAARVDALIEAAADEARIEPAPLADDRAFLRRASVDLIGRIPTHAEQRHYFEDPAPERRRRLVDRLLENDRFVDRWAIFLRDLLRVREGEPGGRALNRFLTEGLARGRPWDEMVRQMLTATGSPGATPAAGLVTAEEADPLAMAAVVSQTFLGVRMGCAQCHDHPFDVWSREDYYHLAAFFGHTKLYQRERPYDVVRVIRSNEPRLRLPAALDAKRPMASPRWPFPEVGGGAAAAAGSSPAGEPSAALDEDLDATIDELTSTTGGFDGVGGGIHGAADSFNERATGAKAASTRQQLAHRVTAPGNRMLRRALANRLWAVLLGHGFVEPVDDFRFDNPPSHPEALDALADHLLASGDRLRPLVRTICLTRAYQRRHPESADPAARRGAVEAFVAARLRRMPAEALFDSLVTAGHLENVKHPAGENLRTRELVLRIRRPREGAMAGDEGEGQIVAESHDPYAPERVLEPSFIRSLTEDPLEGDGFAIENADRLERFAEMGIEARREARRERRRKMAEMADVVIETRTVTETYDDNPRFGYAAAMVGPAPAEHFLRQFGQPARRTLGDRRDNDAAGMRQALILMNGRLVNEAARVGELEPVGQMLINLDRMGPVIELVYVETLTRPPAPLEMKQARSLVEAADDPRAGVADLRWAILNSHEFRYLP